MPKVTPADWDVFTSLFPNIHLLQTSPWGELKNAYGWSVEHVVVGDFQLIQVNQGSSPAQPLLAGAQVLFRRLPLNLTLAYIPKGPVGEKWDDLWPEVDKLCRNRQAIFLKVEPDVWGERDRELSFDKIPPPEPPKGFINSQQTIQPPQTLIVDLTGNEEQVLARMKQKTRYNIRLALKKGVVVHTSEDMDSFYRLVQITGGRDQFGVHSREYYQKAYELFHPRGACELLIAEYQENPLAGLMVFMIGDRAWYLYGASSSDHRDRMPNYLLQWEAMRWARARGCSTYDLWGVPDQNEETLEANFTDRDQGLWGVYRFKRGFGGKLCRAAGPWDRVYRPAMYKLYSWLANRSKGDGD